MNRRTNPRKIELCALFALLALAASREARALEPSTHQDSGIPCAILENFGGELEVLDPSRTRVSTLSKNSGVPCGGWVSSGSGWAVIRHRDGHELRVGPGTFLEIPENDESGPASDQVVLYRGELFGSTEGGAGTLRVVTANARALIQRGTALINFSPDEQDTQLVALDGPASLENRFETGKKVDIKAGESTSLNFKLLRVVPTYPEAVSVASLKTKLSLFRVSDEEQEKMYQIAEARGERRMAADLSSQTDQQASESADAAVSAETRAKDMENEDRSSPVAPQATVSDRRIASENGSKYSYARNPSSPEEDAQLKAHWVKKMTAGEDIGEKILYPDKFYGKPQKVRLLITDPAAGMNAKQHQAEDAEKKRLLQELSQIREE